MPGKQKEGLSGVLLPGTVFVTGMSIMAIEMSASRLIAPYFGTSLLVWTNIIGLIMVALSLGYYAGGRLADKRPDAALFFKLILGAGCFVFVIPFLSSPVMRLSGAGSVGLFLGSLVAVACLFVVPFTLLGMVSPFAIRLASMSIEQVGNTAGSIYAVSTVGSIIGTYVPALLAIPLLGTRRTILLFAAILIMVGLAGLLKLGRVRRAVMIVPIIAFVLAMIGPPGKVKALVHRGRDQLYETESLYNYIQVCEREIRRPSGGRRGRRLLMLNEGYAVHSVYDPESPCFPCVGSVWDYFGICALPLLGKQKGPVDVCIVGLAAGTMALEMLNFYGDSLDVHIDGIELDPEIIRIGRRYFGMNSPKLTAVAGDGRTFLRRTDKKYDFILTDAYRQPYIPFHLTTREYFSLARLRLKPGGIAAINIGSLDDKTAIFRNIVGTMASVFGHVYYIPVSFHGALFTNFVVFASDASLDTGRLNARTNPLLLPVLKTRVGSTVANVLYNAQRNWRGFDTDKSVTVMTDDKAPVEFLTDWLIIKYILSGKAGQAIQREMGIGNKRAKS